VSACSQQIAAFYAEHAATLEGAVARQLRVPPHAIEDACQTAWTILLSRLDVPLTAKASPALQGRPHHRLPHRTPASSPSAPSCPEHEPGELPEHLAPVEDLDERVADRLDRRAELQALTARERRYLALQATGLSYSEIATRELTSQRNVERQLMRAKRKLRQA
jgi:DNA-binding CsgD family transcriptional regulator